MVNLAAEIGIGMRPRHTPTHMYYRQPNGWITSGKAAPIEQTSFVEEGWLPLRQYGRLDVQYEYIGEHPYEVLFMRGGAKEMSVNQVIEAGFWLESPIIPGCNIALNPIHPYHTEECWLNKQSVEFPQVPVNTPKSYDCHFCERKLPTIIAREKHEGVMHREEKGELRTGDALATSLIRGLKGSNSEIVTSKKETIGQINMPYVCGFCSEGFNSPVALGKHVKWHKESR